MTYPTAYLGLGSNEGDRLFHLNAAVQRLSEFGTILQQSTWYETPAWGKTDQADFLNGVISIQPHIGPWELMAAILQIEADFGRRREIKWGPRTLDIDILAFGPWKVHSPNLTLPHPFCTVRDFVLKPWAEIAPHFVLAGKPIQEWEQLNQITV